MADILGEDANPLPVPSARRAVGVPSRLVPVRRLGVVHAGDAMEEMPVEDEVEMPEAVVSEDPGCFALRVTGDCMDRVIPGGYDVAVHPGRRPSDGDVAVVEVGPGEAVMRRWHRYGGTLVLAPDSHDASIEPIVVRDGEGEVRVLGTVVWAQKGFPG